MIEYQHLMLSDAVRNAAYAKALKNVIVPGETVLADIGSGTGFLSFLACKFGAKECHLFEKDRQAYRLSKAIAKQNGFTNCHFYNADSKTVRTVPKVDVIVSETLGHYALEEHIIESLEDAKRMLKPSGIIIPSLVNQYIAPITNKRLYEKFSVWNQLGKDLDYRAARHTALNCMYIEEIKTGDILLDAMQCWDTIDFATFNESKRTTTVEWKAKQNYTMYGCALWWEAKLYENVLLSTAPNKPKTHWDQVYLPFKEPIPMDNGNTVSVTITSDTRSRNSTHLRWIVAEQEKEPIAHDTALGIVR